MWLSFAGGEIMNSSAARLHDMLFYDFDIDKVRAAARAAFRVLDDHLTEREIDGALTGSSATHSDHRRHRLLPLCRA
jgi:glutathione S-transferase